MHALLGENDDTLYNVVPPSAWPQHLYFLLTVKVQAEHESTI